MEFEIERILEAEGYESKNENVYSEQSIELFQKILQSKNIDKALEVYSSELENEELFSVFEKISKHHFFIKLRDSIFRGNFKFAQIRFDIKTSSRFIPQLNEAFFVMRIATTEGQKTVRLTHKMIIKLIEELQQALNIVNKASIRFSILD